MLVIFAIVGLFIQFSAFAQEESLSELAARLDQENLERAQEIQESQTQEQVGFGKVDCPAGQMEKAVSGGGIICVDSGEAVSFDDTTGYIIIGIVIVIIIIAIAARSAKGKPEYVERKDFSIEVKEQVLKNQGHRCNECRKLLDVVDYDHIDGDRSNNELNNCQALCPTCHAKKSRKAQMGIEE